MVVARWSVILYRLLLTVCRLATTAHRTKTACGPRPHAAYWILRRSSYFAAVAFGKFFFTYALGQFSQQKYTASVLTTTILFSASASSPLTGHFLGPSSFTPSFLR